MCRIFLVLLQVCIGISANNSIFYARWNEVSEINDSAKCLYYALLMQAKACDVVDAFQFIVKQRYDDYIRTNMLVTCSEIWQANNFQPI